MQYLLIDSRGLVEFGDGGHPDIGFKTGTAPLKYASTAGLEYTEDLVDTFHRLYVVSDVGEQAGLLLLHLGG